MRIPSGTPIIAASAKPPNTRQIVTPMSSEKPCRTSNRQPEATIVTGSARNVLLTKPPNVATPHAAKNTAKNSTPSAIFAPGETGASGLSVVEAAVGFPGGRRTFGESEGPCRAPQLNG